MFQQFMKLPPAQKAGVLAAVLVLLGAGVYFMAIEPVLAKTKTNEVNLRKVNTELAQLRETARDEAVVKLRKQKDQLVELDKENRKMLPTSDEVPDFIDLVQRDAVSAGLRVTRFDRLKTESQDLVNAIPVKMTVQGTMLDLIAFLRVYASGDRRVINVRQMAIEAIKPDMAQVRREYKAGRPLEVADRRVDQQKSSAELLLERIEILDLARKKSEIRATFVAYAFIWTGLPATITAGSGSKIKRKKKRT